jgi:hypothetical protein
MKDNIEDFIRNNRNAFDDKEPSEKVWTKIDQAIKPKQSVWNSLTVWRAAAVLFMGLSIYLLIPKDYHPVQNEVAMKEFRDVEAFYVKQISDKVEMIDEFNKNEGLNGFTHDFQQLEAMYLVLREEMKSRPSQKVKDALVLNLLVQIDLLNQHIHSLEKEVVQPEKEEKSPTNI